MEKILKNISNKADYDEFIQVLYSFSKNESIKDKERHKAIINTKQEIIGISMKNIRAISKIISKYCAEKFLEITKNKDPKNSFYEETLIEGLVIAQISNINEQIKRLNLWIKKIDNWSTCDSVVCTLKILKKSRKNNEYYSLFKTMAQSNREFIARFAIVTLMSIYLNKENINDIYQLLTTIKSDKYYINMAIAWLIASGFLIDKQSTYNLLKSKVLNKFVQNKTISKCRDSFQVSIEDKEKLKSLRM